MYDKLVTVNLNPSKERIKELREKKFGLDRDKTPTQANLTSYRPLPKYRVLNIETREEFIGTKEEICDELKTNRETLNNLMSRRTQKTKTGWVYVATL